MMGTANSKRMCQELRWGPLSGVLRVDASAQGNTWQAWSCPLRSTGSLCSRPRRTGHPARPLSPHMPGGSAPPTALPGLVLWLVGSYPQTWFVAPTSSQGRCRPFPNSTALQTSTWGHPRCPVLIPELQRLCKGD